MNRILSLISIIPFIFSCSQPISKERKLNYTVQPKIISTGNSLAQFYFFNQVRNDSLFLFNSFNHSLDIVDLKSDSVASRIKLEFDGPNAVNDIRTFYFHNRDSIFLAEENFSVALVNSKGELKNRYTDFLAGFPSNEKSEVYSNSPSLEFASQLLYHPVNKEILLYFMPFNQPEKKRIFASYSLETGKSKSLPIHLPEQYWDKKLDLSKLFLTSGTLDKSGFTYLFSGSPFIFRYDFQTQKVTSFEINPSWEKAKADDIPFGSMSVSQKQAFMRENPFYYKIYFDPYRNLYYRLSSPPRPNSTEENFHYVNYNRICLTVLDKDLQVLDHLFLPKENVYNVGFSFVTSEGLWISYNGANQDDENWIKGDLIQLDKVVN
ncbi:DUF4221 family protein [Algoriphagus taiwanensis]|uniref:DUF4221 domain-containing protein n=1 Tax=Algoriphagus taiwanensis TaxID=1445656 RepID=A0ABQ6Q812_9BACT|nr:hypothetical protein Ataiwa_39360 [Algoriphagus taiwanensis]